jgi:hypothetical protein
LRVRYDRSALIKSANLRVAVSDHLGKPVISRICADRVTSASVTIPIKGDYTISIAGKDLPTTGVPF